jgi:hypothetical protein
MILLSDDLNHVNHRAHLKLTTKKLKILPIKKLQQTTPITITKEQFNP